MQVGLHDDDEQVCQMEGCTEIDLLPARCSNCHKVFCSQHISGSAHHCTAAKNAIVTTCPVCHRVVQPEYAGQDVNDAVSRHLDRGCRTPPAAPPLQATSSVASKSFLDRAFDCMTCSKDQLSVKSEGGRRLGGGATAPPRRCTCGVPGCVSALGVLVPCDQCGRLFCTTHRNPTTHHCTGGVGANAAARVDPSRHSPARSQAATRQVTTSLETLLTSPSNTPNSAHGTASGTESCTPLVCFVVPDTPSSSSSSPADTTLKTSQDDATCAPKSTGFFSRSSPKTSTSYLAMAPFYMHVSKNYSLGRMLDLAMDVATVRHASATAATATRWNVFLIQLPVPAAACETMYPAQSLATVVRNTVLGQNRRCVVVVSTLQTLPSKMLDAVRKVQRRL